MNKLLAILLATVAISAQATDMVGAGANFPFPIYYKLAEGYKKDTGKTLNYQSICSS